MSIKSIEQLLAQADATIEDNIAGNISAADVRNLFKDFLDTMGPGYGVMRLTSLAQAVTATPAKITPWTAIEEITAGYYNVSVAIGEVTRLIASASITGATDFIMASGSVNGPNNGNLTLEIFKDGVATGLKTSVTCTGLTDNVGFNIVGLSYKAGADAVYDLRASSPNTGNYNYSNVQFLAQSQAVRAY